MSGYYHVGDAVTQYGDRNIGIVKNQGPADPHAALADLIDAVQVLRGHVSDADRRVIDDSIRAIGTGNDVAKPALRRALANIAGVATMVGEVGVPVIELIRKVAAAVGVN